MIEIGQKLCNAVQGTVHLQMPRLAPVCRKLQVDFAPAMTGFDIKGGRSVPIIDGVVVCKEDEASILEAYLEEERSAHGILSLLILKGRFISELAVAVTSQMSCELQIKHTKTETFPVEAGPMLVLPLSCQKTWYQQSIWCL